MDYVLEIAKWFINAGIINPGEPYNQTHIMLFQNVQNVKLYRIIYLLYINNTEIKTIKIK